MAGDLNFNEAQTTQPKKNAFVVISIWDAGWWEQLYGRTLAACPTSLPVLLTVSQLGKGRRNPLTACKGTVSNRTFGKHPD